MSVSASIRQTVGRTTTACLPAALCALASAWLFRSHLAGTEVFIGNHDRLFASLNFVSFFADALREKTLHAWTDSTFGGLNVYGLPYIFPSPLLALPALAKEADFFYWAGVNAFLLLAVAGWVAYLFIHDVCQDRFAATVGGILYEFAALTTLKVSQNDLSFAVLICIPLLMLIIRRIGATNTSRCFAGLAALVLFLFLCTFLQKAAYAMMLGSAYALYRSWSLRSVRPVAVFVMAALVGITGAFPRIYTVGNEMSQFLRDYPGYENVQAAPPIFALRWFEYSLFGRWWGSEIVSHNQINLSEGMLLYTSPLSTLLVLSVLVRFGGRWLKLWRSCEEDGAFLSWSFLIIFAVPVSYYLTYGMYVLFFCKDFTHARILVIAVLPLCTLIALALRDQMRPQAAGLRVFLLALPVAVLLFTLSRLASEERGEWIQAPAFIGTNFRLLVSALWHVAAGMVIFSALTVLPLLVRRPGVRSCCGFVLGVFLVLDAGHDADIRISGPVDEGSPHLFADWVGGGDAFVARAGDFVPPSRAARRALAERLNPDAYRSVTICDLPVLCAPHVASFWKLRLIDGYSSGVPKTLASLPWPGNTRSLRSISFTSHDPLPWPLLSLLNVRYAVEVSEPFLRNNAQPGSGRRTEIDPGQVRVIENPLPVVPRHFFTRKTTGAASIEAAVDTLFPDGRPTAQVTDLSVVEGLEGECRFGAGSMLHACYDGDRIDLYFEPTDSPRFLVVNERYHPRWHAYCDGQEATLYRTNVVMRGVLVPARSSHVSMRFIPFVTSPKAFPFYLVAGIAAIFGVGLWRQQDRRKIREMVTSAAG